MNVAMRGQKFLDARGLVGRGIVGDDVNFLAVGLVHDDVGEKRLGLGLYGAVFVVYAAALARLPFNVAHPVLTSGAVASVALLSVLIFGEPFYWTRGVGILLVIAGVVLITARVA